VRLECRVVSAVLRFWLLIVREPSRVWLKRLYWVNRVFSNVHVVFNLDCLNLGEETGSLTQCDRACLHGIVRRRLLMLAFYSYRSGLPLPLIPHFDCPFELFLKLERHLHEFVDGVYSFGKVKLSNLIAKFQSLDVATNVPHFRPVLIVY